MLAVLLGDFAWRRNARWQRAILIEGCRRVVLRPQTSVLLLVVVVLVLLFAAIVFAIHTPTGALMRFETSMAKSLRASLLPPVLGAIAQLTHLRDLLWVAPVAGAVLLVLLWHRHWQLGATWLVLCISVAKYRQSRPSTHSARRTLLSVSAKPDQT